MAGAYPKCTDCIPDPCLQPGYVDVIYFDTRVRHYAGHSEMLWVGEEVNAYADLAKDNEGVGRISLGQHTLDDFTGKEGDCDLIAYFWDNDLEQLFAVERSRSTGVDGDELWRVGTGATHPGFPCKSNNGFVVFLRFYTTIPGGSSGNTTMVWRDVHTGSATRSLDGPGYWTWATPLNDEKGIGVNAGVTNFEAPLEGSALNVDELLPDDPPYAYATNFLMGGGAMFAGVVETEAGDPVVITLDRGIWRHLPGNLISDSYTEQLDENLYGFVSQWCDKLYVVRNSPGSGVDRWPYTGASTFLGTDAIYTGGRAAYVVKDTFPDGGDETEDPAECPCDGGDGGGDCDGCDCSAGEFEIDIVSEPDESEPGCWLVTVNCVSSPCDGDMTNFVWTIPTGDCETVTYGPGYGWQDGTCGEEFQVCGDYLVVRITDSCGCKTTICLELQEQTACECCDNVEPTQVEITIASITNQAEVTCPDCPDANGTYSDAVEPTGTGGCSWVLAGGACHLLAEDICEGSNNFLLYYTATLSITNCGIGDITITSTIGVQLFISSDENCSGSVVGGCTYQKVVVVDELDQPADCLSLINGTHTNTESCSAGSACVLPDEITVTWS